MAEEDLIFGKNRHFFGGIAPSNMLRFSAKRGNANNQVEITCELPAETVVGGQVICTVAGAIIRKSAERYPETEFDGELVADISANGKVYDTNVEEGAMYYYSAFPYSKMGVYNRNKLNRTDIAVTKGTYVYGYDLNTNDSDPATRVTYPGDVDNAYFASARMDFSTYIFNYGGWTNAPGDKFMPKPCMLKYDGTVDYYLDPNDYTKKEDGTASDVSNTSYSGNAMMEWPKIYTKRWEENGIYHFRCSDVKQDVDWDCWCNYDINNNEINHFYTPIYPGYMTGNKLRSLSGVGTGSAWTAHNLLTYAGNNGDGWTPETLVDTLLITDLLVMMGKSTHCQDIYGVGYYNNALSLSTGSMNTQGMFYGNTSSSGRVKIFGMEDWWGGKLRFLAGWVSVNGVQKIKFTPGTKDGSTTTGYNRTGSGYLYLDDGKTWSAFNGAINKCKATAFGRIPISASGSYSTYEADEFKFGVNGTSCAHRGTDGPFSTYIYEITGAENTGYGGAPSCKPSAT